MPKKIEIYIFTLKCEKNKIEITSIVAGLNSIQLRFIRDNLKKSEK
jgi:hypothetical protein